MKRGDDMTADQRSNNHSAPPHLPPTQAAAPVAYVERRAPRGFFGVVWKWGLVLWTLAFAYDVMRISFVASDLSKKTGGLGALAISNMASNRIVETLIVWFFGALVLGALTYVTRGAKILEAMPIAPNAKR